MTRSYLMRYLDGRLGFIAAHVTGTLLVLAVVGTNAAYSGPFPWSTLAYGLLLSSLVLSLFLALDLMRRWRFDMALLRLAQSEHPLEELAILPAPASFDQGIAESLLIHLQRHTLAQQAEAQHRFSDHRRFMDLWVHQMKSPLSTIRLTVQQALAQPAGGSAGPEALQALDDEAQKLDEGLTTVLSMARLTDFALDFHIEPVDLAALVRSQIHERKRQFIRSAIFPAVQTSGADRFVVLTDAKWLGFVIDQLTSNALKYGAQGGAAGGKITYHLAAEGQQVRLYIMDPGPGIPPEDLPRIWEPFFTGQNGRRYAGATGIGLSLVKQVIDRLGHHIEANSEVGKGTSMTMTFRLTKL